MRLLVPLARALSVAAFVVPGLIGCGDKRTNPSEARDAEHTAPRAKTELEKLVADLGDGGKQQGAMKRLIELHADAESEDQQSDDKPHVRAVLDKISDPLARVCLGDNLKDQDRSQLVRFMAHTRDRRARPCLKKTLEDYRPDTNESDVQEVLRALTAMGRMKGEAEAAAKSLTPQVVKVFRTIEYANEKARPLRKDMIAALTTLVDKSLEEDFIKVIDRPYDPQDRRGSFNEGFWQDGAARVLGELKSEQAARPLVKFILTPSKGPFHTSALIALVKIGKASIPPVEAVLKGDDKALIQYSTEENLKAIDDSRGPMSMSAQKAAARAHIAIAAQILGNLGSEASIRPLLDAISSAGDDLQTKVIVAHSLTLLPHVASTKEAYRKVYEALKVDVEFQGHSAKEFLAESSSDFFDDGFTPWLVKTSAELKGGKSESDVLDPLRTSAFIASTRVMTAAQIPEVESLAATRAYRPDVKDGTKKVETRILEAFKKEFEQAKKLLGDCKDVSCFLAAGSHEDNQKLDKQFIALKAIYMVGILGKAEDVGKLIDALPTITNAAVRLTALKAIEHLTPRGDLAAADKLQALYDDAEKRKDEKLMLEYGPFVQTAARLRARSQ